MPWRLSSLRTGLLIFLLLAAIPAVTLAFYNALERRAEDAASVKQEALTLAKFASSRQEQLITETSQLLAFLAMQPQVQTGDAATCSSYLANVMKQYPLYTGVVVANTKGDLYCSGLPLLQPTNVADRPHFQRAMEIRNFTIGDYQVGRTSGKAILGLGYPVLDDVGNIKSIIFASIDLNWINEFVADTALLPEARLWVVDSNGTLLVRYPDPQDWVGKSVVEYPIVKQILATQGDGTAEAPGLNGVPSLFAFTQLGGPTLSGAIYVAIVVPKSVAFASATNALRRSLIGLGIVFSIALAVVWLGVETIIVRRARVLIRATQKLASGDLKARSGLNRKNAGELGQLAESFDLMAQKLEEHESERVVLEKSRIQLTEERARRVRSETMLKEVQHRVQNSLQVVASLLSLQASESKNPESLVAFRDTEARIRTIAMIHSRLNVEQDEAQVNFGKHLREMLPAMIQAQADTRRVSLQVFASDILFPWPTAIPCALIVNELVTNSIKHAFPGNRKGNIRVELLTNGAEEVILTVSDDGVGIPKDVDTGNPQRVGLQLVNALTDQLHGTIALERNEGTLFRIKFANTLKGMRP